MRLAQRILQSLRVRLDRVNIIHRDAIVASSAWVSGSEIGPICSVAEGCKIYQSVMSGKVVVDRYTSLWGPSIQINGGSDGVHLGAFCSVAHHVNVQEQNHNPQRTTTYFIERNLLGKEDTANAMITKGSINIGNDVWIGAGAQILSGVRIGDGAIIGAGAIVSRDVKPYAVVGGNPARLIRFRFSAERIEQLLELQWWNWGQERLESEIKFLTELHDAPQ